MPKAIAQPGGDHRQRGRAAGDPSRRTRDALLAATATAIARNGWSAITTRQVAALAGVNPALVHYHFDSMDELRYEAALTAMAEEIEGPMGALLADVPLSDAIAACVDSVARIDTGSDRFALLYEVLLEGGRDPQMRDVLVKAYDDFRAALAGRVREAGGRDPEGAAVVITAALDGVLLHRLVKPDLDVVGLTSTLMAALQIPPSADPGDVRSDQAS
jgi:AcrR family transcriptional regulator